MKWEGGQGENGRSKHFFVGEKKNETFYFVRFGKDFNVEGKNVRWFVFIVCRFGLDLDCESVCVSMVVVLLCLIGENGRMKLISSSFLM